MEPDAYINLVNYAKKPIGEVVPTSREKFIYSGVNKDSGGSGLDGASSLGGLAVNYKHNNLLDVIARQTKTFSSASLKMTDALYSISDAINNLSANNTDNGVASSITDLKSILSQGVEYQKRITDIENDRFEYEKTKKDFVDMDGERIANMSPRDAKTVRDLTQARLATDTNNFELSGDDILGLFDDLPDPSGLFSFPIPG